MNSAYLIYRAVRSLFLLTLLMTAVVPILHAQDAPLPFRMPEQFSVEMTITPPSGDKVKINYYNAQGKLRIDTMTAGVRQSRVLRQDVGAVYDINHQRRVYSSSPYKAEAAVLVLGMPITGKWDKATTEKIGGKTMNRYKLTPPADGPKALIFWVDPATQCPAKIEVQLKSVRGAAPKSTIMEFGNYNIAPQPDALFDPPAGYSDSR